MIVTVISGAFLPLRTLPANPAQGMAWTNRTVLSLPETMPGVFVNDKRQQPIPTVPFPLKFYTTGAPTKFSVIHSDKNGNVLDRWENVVSNLYWTSERFGGCGVCEFDINVNYTNYTISADDDIQIWQKDVANPGLGKLFYRGFVNQWTREIGTAQKIHVVCNGYFKKLERYIVNSGGTTKVYSGMSLDGIVTDLFNTFLNGLNTPALSLGPIDVSNFSPDSLYFKGTVTDALNSLAELSDPQAEYGINEKLQLYWKNESTVVNNRFFIGKDISLYSELNDSDGIINGIYFEGNTSGSTAFVASGANTDSKSSFNIHESLISNSSINTSSTAAQIINALLKKNARPKAKINVTIHSQTARFEDNYPMGTVMIIDPLTAQTSNLWGITANGGSNLIWGTTANGGSGKKWGTNPSFQINRITYSPSNQDGYMDYQLELGDSRFDTPALIRQIESDIDAIRQRQIA